MDRVKEVCPWSSGIGYDCEKEAGHGWFTRREMLALDLAPGNKSAVSFIASVLQKSAHAEGAPQ